MFSGIWTRYQLDVADNAQYFKELSPKRLAIGSFVRTQLWVQHLYEVAENELVDVYDFLSDFGQVHRRGMPTGPASTFATNVAHTQHAVFLRATLRASEIRRHYEVARIDAHAVHQHASQHVKIRKAVI